MLFVGVTVTVRYLGTNMNPVQAAFIRYCFGILMILPLLSRAGVFSLNPGRLGFHALRGLMHGGGVMLWFLAMSRIPIAEVTALGFTTPIFATLGAAVFLSVAAEALSGRGGAAGLYRRIADPAPGISGN